MAFVFGFPLPSPEVFRSVLERRLDLIGSQLAFWTMLVVLGLLFEYGSEMAGHIPEEWRPRKPRLFRWIGAWKLIGMLLITGGVAGELFIGFSASVAETNLRDFNNDLNVAMQRQVAQANERTSANEKEAAQLRKEAEDERLARVKLEKEVQPRTISESDCKKLSKALGKFASSFKGRKINISSQSGDAEGMVFSLEIMDLLTSAGIDVDPTGMGRFIPVGTVYIGARVTGPPSDEAFIRTLVHGLTTDAKTAVEGDWRSTYPSVSVLVGVKPIFGPLKHKQSAAP